MDVFTIPKSSIPSLFYDREIWGQGVKGGPKELLPTTPLLIQPPAVPRASITTAAQRFSGSCCYDNSRINWHAQTLCLNRKSDIIA